ncbi:hypothetical protein HII09_000577 [Escherichia coli]|nr:hypothetical protein [Escherichia coli]
MRLCARGTVKPTGCHGKSSSPAPALIINWLTSPGGTRHRINKVHL